MKQSNEWGILSYTASDKTDAYFIAVFIKDCVCIIALQNIGVEGCLKGEG